MIHFVLLHGWASDGRIWEKVAVVLEQSGAKVSILDFGYTGHKNDDIDMTDCVVVAHSLGLMYAYERIVQTGQKPTMILSISGFTKFSESADFKGIKKRILDRMDKALNTDIIVCLEAFRKNANCSEDFSDVQWDKKLIKEGMRDLIHMDMRCVKQTLNIPQHNLWGSEDAIVSNIMTQQCFDTFDVLKGCGHFIPLQMPEKCSEFILKNV